jgi:hypothetical protein
MQDGDRDVLRKLEKLRGHQVDYLSTVLRLAMFNDMLGHVIPVLILDQQICAHVQLLQYRSLGAFVAMLQHTLDNTAAIRVCRKGVHLAIKSLDDELNVLSRNPLNGLLNNMVAILVLYTLKDVSI